MEDINLTTIHLISVIVSKILEKFIYHTLYIHMHVRFNVSKTLEHLSANLEYFFYK